MNDAWSIENMAGKSVDVYQPLVAPRLGILFLHPYGLETLVDRPEFTKPLEQRNLACVCPHAQRSWWTERICAEFDERMSPEQFLLEHIVPFFRARFRIEPPRIGLLGISMGGQGALRLAFRHPKLFPVAAGIASAFDFHELYGQGTALDDMFDSKEHARQATALLQIDPTQYPPHLYFCIDPDDAAWFRGNDRLHEKLAALGVAHTTDLSTRAGGHSSQYFNHMAEPALRFLHDALQQESRRLL